MNRETVRNDRIRRKKLANDENDGRVQEHKKLNELSDQLQKAYETAWPSECHPQTLDELLQLILNFMDQIPALSQLSLDERRSIAYQRFQPLIVSFLIATKFLSKIKLSKYKFTELTCRQNIHKYNTLF
jgi:hypothetical protein